MLAVAILQGSATAAWLSPRARPTAGAFGGCQPLASGADLLHPVVFAEAPVPVTWKSVSRRFPERCRWVTGTELRERHDVVRSRLLQGLVNAHKTVWPVK